MLVLTHRPGEQIALGNDIQLTVVAVCGSRVVLGLTAPPDVTVRREELAPPAGHVPGACPEPGDRRRPRQ
jgi:carbon storage regulator